MSLSTDISFVVNALFALSLNVELRQSNFNINHITSIHDLWLWVGCTLGENYGRNINALTFIINMCNFLSTIYFLRSDS